MMGPDGLGRRRRLRNLLGGDPHLDVVSFDADFKGVDLDLGVVAPFAIVNAESPGVPRARDDARFQVASSERGSHVGAKIVDGRELAVLIEDGNHAAVDGKRLSLAIRDVGNFGDGNKF